MAPCSTIPPLFPEGCLLKRAWNIGVLRVFAAPYSIFGGPTLAQLAIVDSIATQLKAACVSSAKKHITAFLTIGKSSYFTKAVITETCK